MRAVAAVLASALAFGPGLATADEASRVLIARSVVVHVGSAPQASRLNIRVSGSGEICPKRVLVSRQSRPRLLPATRVRGSRRGWVLDGDTERGQRWSSWALRRLGEVGHVSFSVGVIARNGTRSLCFFTVTQTGERSAVTDVVRISR